MDAMKALTMVTVCVLLIGGTPVLFSGTNTADTESIQGTEGEYFVLDKKLKNSQIEIIAEYSDSVLARADSDMVDKLSREHEIDRLKGRNKIHIKDYSFDIREGPEIPEELKIEGYESDEEGMYLLHMIGPVHPDWREKLIEEGVEIFNYIPNYSYHVKMTPEEKRSVSGLDFVDWIDPYHPAYKIPKDLETGKVIVSSYSGEANRMISHRSDVDILDLQMGADLVLEVDKMSTIEELARMKEVIHLSEYVKPGLDSEVGSQIIGGGVWVHDDDDDPTTPYRVYDDHGALVNQLGYNGSDVTVAIADTGLGNGNMTGAGHEDFEGRIIGGKGYGSADGWGDGHGHGTHTAGLMAGDTYRGTGEKYEGFGPYYASQALASNSSMYVEKIFLDNGNPAGFDYYSLLEDAKKNASAYVHSNSWGASSYGHYSYSDSTYDRAVRDSDSTTEGNQPMVISVSAGNNGKEQSTGSPGNAKNVITVGATETYMPDARSYGNLGGDYDNPDMIADFSSRGWTVDNRVKPTLVAPGDGTLSTHTPELDHSNLYGLYSRDERYEWCSGTSQSAPTVSGASAVVVDWYEQNHGEKPSPSMVKALMINTAYDLDDENGNTGPVPNKKEGWGMVDLVPIVEPKTNRELIDQESLLTTGDEDTYLYQYDDESEPMNLTLTWTDVEAETDDNVTLKNDLDLKVIGPDGDLVYKGNAFDRDDDSLSDSGYTYPNTDTLSDFDGDGDGYDDRNVVENVKISPSELKGGVYQIKVLGEHIPLDSNNDGVANQDYSLVMSNVKPVNSDGEVTFDNKKAAVEDTLEITVTDTDISDSVNVTVTSESEPGGEEVELIETNIAGEFTGSIDVSADDEPGVLQVSDNETVEVSYLDEDDGDGNSLYKRDSLDIDGQPPEILKLDPNTAIGMKLSVRTDEDSTSVLNYGYDPSLGETKSIDVLTDHHIYDLENIRPGERVYYEIELRDQVGNSKIYDDGGTPYDAKIDYFDDVESGNIGWRSDEYWEIWDEQSYEGSKAWNIGQGDYEEDLDSKLRTVTLNTSAIEGPVILSWWHKYDFHVIEHHEEDYDDEYVDGGVVDVYDGGKFWTRMHPQRGYDEELAKVGQHRLSEQEAFAGQSDGWEFEWVNVSKYVDDPEITIRFRMASSYMAENPYVADYRGWNIDNIYFGPMPDHRPYIKPQESEKIGNQGMDITHEIEVMNMGGEDDTFDLKIGGAEWRTDILDETGNEIDSISLESNSTEKVLIRSHIPEEAEIGASDLAKLILESQNSTENRTTEISTKAHEKILLVDDDGGNRTKLTEDYFAPALDGIDRDYDMYTVPHVNSMNQPEGPPYERMKWYDLVIWNTGDARNPNNYPWTLSAEDEENISMYLEEGGRLWLTSKHYLYSRGHNTSFDEDYLKVEDYTAMEGLEAIEGVEGDPITDGMNEMDVYGAYYADSIKAGEDGSVIFRDEGGDGAAVRTDNQNLPYRLVFFPFWFEGIYFQNHDNGRTVAERVLDWLSEPMVQFSTPSHEGYDVSVGQEVRIEFSQSMNTSIVPDIEVESGTDTGGWEFAGWETTDRENDTAVWNHDDWLRDELITLNISGFECAEGMTGDPYHFSFGTEETIKPDVSDQTEGTPTTGDEFYLEAAVEDNMKVSEVYLEYRSDVYETDNLTMDHVGGSKYSVGIEVPSSAYELNYKISAVDPSGNWNATEEKNLSVSDDNPPSVTDKTIGSPATGEKFSFKAEAEDNRGSVDEVIVNYQLKYVNGTNETISETMELNEESYRKEIDVPADTEVLSYQFETVDSNGNEGTTDERKLFVIDTLEPKADAGDNVIAGLGEEFKLNGSNSEDNVEIINFTWEVEDQTLSGPVVSHEIDRLGTFEATLTVKDESGNTDEDKTLVEIVDDEKPVADAGSDKEVECFEEVTFDASNSTDNVEISSHIWKMDGEELHGETVQHTFEECGEYEVELVVEDTYGNTDKDFLTVAVVDDERPSAEAGSDIRVMAGEVFTLDGSASHDENGISRYTWNIAGEEVSGETVDYEIDKGGTYKAELTVEDRCGNTAKDVLTIEIKVEISIGPVKSEKGERLEDVDVYLREGGKLVDNATTDREGEAAFVLVPEGEEEYTVLVEHGDQSREVGVENRRTGPITLKTGDTFFGYWILVAVVAGVIAFVVLAWYRYRR